MKYNIFTGRPVIHVFGDSHSLFLQDPLFIIHHVGPATAYKLSSNSSTTRARDKIFSTLEKQKGKYLLFIFGEIDCRIHINNISKSSRVTLDTVIQNTITSYGKFLIDIKNKYPDSTIMVLNVLPPGEEKNIYNVPNYPSRELHLKIVKKFNKSLQSFCENNNFVYLCVFDVLLDKNSKRRSMYIYDDVHYNKKSISFIIRELKNKINIV